MKLAALKGLKSLNLTETGLTDVCLEKLITELENLQNLRIAGNRIVRNSNIRGSAFIRLEDKNITRPNLRKEWILFF